MTARRFPDLGAAVVSVTAPVVAAVMGVTRASLRDEVSQPLRTVRDAGLSNYNRAAAWLTALLAIVPLYFIVDTIETHQRGPSSNADLTTAIVMPILGFCWLTALLHLGRLFFLRAGDERDWSSVAAWRRLLGTPGNLDLLIPAVIVGGLTALAHIGA